jgi:hypothetical protein
MTIIRERPSEKFSVYTKALVIFILGSTAFAMCQTALLLLAFNPRIDEVTQVIVAGPGSSGNFSAYFASYGGMIILIALAYIICFKVLVPKKPLHYFLTALSIHVSILAIFGGFYVGGTLFFLA